jgi:TRAP-type C4-dicarboxylate transport system permease small subunit
MEQPSQPVSLFRRIVRWITEGMVVISALMLALMMLISTVDVIGRYFFLHPVEGAWEIVSMAFVICGSMAIGYTQLIKGHIQINLVSDRLTPRGRAVLFIVSYSICFVGSALVTWQGWLRAWDYMHKTVGGETITLGIVIWPFMLIFTIGFFWLAFILLIDIYDLFVEVIRR